MRSKAALLALLCALLPGCQTDSRDQILAIDRSQAALRAAQSRSYDIGDKAKIMAATVGTLQDLGFTVDKVDSAIGIVSGTKAGNYRLRMTISIQVIGPKRSLVRASAQFNIEAVSDAAPYQQFFNALDQALFIDSQKVF